MAISNIGSSKNPPPKDSVATASVAIAGKSSRACDVCGLQRAQWYCAADEAYLCERCDTGVHCANSVAWRHERVRLGPNGAPLKMPKRSTSHRLSKPYKKGAKEAARTGLAMQPLADRGQRHAPPPPPTAVVLPSRKRFRSIRTHPQRLKRSTDPGAPNSKVCKTSKASDVHDQQVKVEFVDLCEISDDVVDDGGAHEVPAFITVNQDSNESQTSELEGYINNTGSFLREVQSASSDSFLGIFKCKAAQALAQGNLRAIKGDQLLVPDSFDDILDSGVDISVNVDGTVSLIGNSDSSAAFVGGDIPGLVTDVFDGFDISRGFSDVDYGLNFDLAIRDGSEEDYGIGGGVAFEGGGCFTSTTSSDGCGSSFSSGVNQQQPWDLENISPTPSPFARFFASSRVKTEEDDATKQLQGREKLKKEAKEILKCSLEGLSEEDLRHVPSLRLDYEEVLNAWSDRGVLWTDDNMSPQTVPGEDSFNPDTPGSCTTDMCLVPDTMSQGKDGTRATDDALSNEGREARVLRYKEKRRTRLFSKKIRYEVRKVNAERRPRMKGRFVKRIQLLS